MDYQFKTLQKKDIQTISRFAVVGMHFNRYLPDGFLLTMMGRHFFLSELSRATKVIAAYQGDKLAGVLLAEMKGEATQDGPWYRRAFIHTIDFLSSLMAKDGIDAYEAANQELLEQYKQSNLYDGEICFLAADPDTQSKGIGTALLQELARRELGKKVIVFTDTSCAYQFYEHRGFQLEGQKEITAELNRQTYSLECFLYSKIL